MKNSGTIQRKSTKSSSFGSPGRISHDSSPFYNSKLYEELPKEQRVEYIENYILMNRIQYLRALI